jgi:hypothetical protein
MMSVILVQPGGVMFLIGKRFVANPTALNRKQGIASGVSAYIAFVDPAAISVLVIVNGGTELKLCVPRALFGVNFSEADPYAQQPNMAYAHTKHFDTVYG